MIQWTPWTLGKILWVLHEFPGTDSLFPRQEALGKIFQSTRAPWPQSPAAASCVKSLASQGVFILEELLVCSVTMSTPPDLLPEPQHLFSQLWTPSSEHYSTRNPSPFQRGSGKKTVPVMCCLFFFFQELPRLEIESVLQPPAYTTIPPMQDLSHICDLYHSSQQCQILNPLSEARDGTGNLTVPSS